MPHNKQEWRTRVVEIVNNCRDENDYISTIQILEIIKNELSLQKKEIVEDLEQWARARMTYYEGSELKEKLAQIRQSASLIEEE